MIAPCLTGAKLIRYECTLCASLRHLSLWHIPISPNHWQSPDQDPEQSSSSLIQTVLMMHHHHHHHWHWHTHHAATRNARTAASPRLPIPPNPTFFIRRSISHLAPRSSFSTHTKREKPTSSTPKIVTVLAAFAKPAARFRY